MSDISCNLGRLTPSAASPCHDHDHYLLAQAKPASPHLHYCMKNNSAETYFFVWVLRMNVPQFAFMFLFYGMAC